MSWLREDSPSKLISLGRMTSWLLITLESYVENTNLKLKDRDYEAITDAKNFLNRVITGCESFNELKKLFLYDENDLYPTPNLAFRIANELVPSNMMWNPPEIKKRCYSYQRILENIQSEIQLSEKEKPLAKETLLFFDGLDAKCQKWTREHLFGLGYS